eukprot:GHVQ01025070.1.p1 GENE.GHVQ01025070.1~~GHVQ01025070.1.p1  ORF type:complete len:534 (-),score=24.86 GHVQ01025070.1:1496-3097(-)
MQRGSQKQGWNIVDKVHPRLCAFSVGIFACDLAIGLAILRFARYTPIDWSSYMMFADRFLSNEETNYYNFVGDTGPCVYPAGFLYIFSLFYTLTDGGSDVVKGQWIFLVIYLLQLACLLIIYFHSDLLLNKHSCELLRARKIQNEPSNTVGESFSESLGSKEIIRKRSTIKGQQSRQESACDFEIVNGVTTDTVEKIRTSQSSSPQPTHTTSGLSALWSKPSRLCMSEEPWIQPIYVALLMLIASKRIHSIFLLRLFNDGVAMTLLYLSLLLLLRSQFVAACIVYSLSVSVKMNTLLFAPGLLFILYYIASQGNWKKCLGYLCLCAVVQLLLGLPFLLSFPVAYIHRAFEFSRQFQFVWSVNWAFLPEKLFLSVGWALLLLVLHVSVLVWFWKCRWLRCLVESTSESPASVRRVNYKRTIMPFKLTTDTHLSSDGILYVMISSNVIGILFARSLHYQFYSWYFHCVPWIVMTAPIPLILKAGIATVLETCWLLYPPNAYVSFILLVVHISLVLLLAVFPPLQQRVNDMKVCRD